jgi:hypothetical protein
LAPPGYVRLGSGGVDDEDRHAALPALDGGDEPLDLAVAVALLVEASCDGLSVEWEGGRRAKRLAPRQ